MTANAVLQATNLAVGYRGRRVRENVDVVLRSGEMVCLLGRNGAGKSTLLRTLAGLDRPLAGTVEISTAEIGSPSENGMTDLHAMMPRERARRLGVVLPERLELGLMTARELVNLGRHPHTGWSGRLTAADVKRVDAAMAELGIASFADRVVASLSDGERQKVMIARALAQEPQLFLLDEPTAFLDLPGRVEVLTMLHDLTRTAPRTVLVSTHELDLALRLADRLWVLPPGGGLIDGTPDELRRYGVLATAFASSTAMSTDVLGEILSL